MRDPPDGAPLHLAGPGPGPLAYPITPVTLWDLTGEADLVVLADITEVTEAADAGGTSLRDAPSKAPRPTSRTAATGVSARGHPGEAAGHPAEHCTQSNRRHAP